MGLGGRRWRGTENQKKKKKEGKEELRQKESIPIVCRFVSLGYG